MGWFGKPDVKAARLPASERIQSSRAQSERRSSPTCADHTNVLSLLKKASYDMLNRRTGGEGFGPLGTPRDDQEVKFFLRNF